jgi:hypothetical protein
MRNHLLSSTTVTHPSYNANGQYTAPVLLFAFLIGLLCCKSHVVFVLLIYQYLGASSDNLCSTDVVVRNRSRSIHNVCSQSNVISMRPYLTQSEHASFVGLGEDPQVLAIRAPELFSVCPGTYQTCLSS